MMRKEKRTTLIVALALSLALFLGLLQWILRDRLMLLRGDAAYTPLYQPMTLPAAQAPTTRTSTRELRERRVRRPRASSVHPSAPTPVTAPSPVR